MWSGTSGRTTRRCRLRRRPARLWSRRWRTGCARRGRTRSSSATARCARASARQPPTSTALCSTRRPSPRCSTPSTSSVPFSSRRAGWSAPPHWHMQRCPSSSCRWRPSPGGPISSSRWTSAFPPAQCITASSPPTSSLARLGRGRRCAPSLSLSRTTWRAYRSEPDLYGRAVLARHLPACARVRCGGGRRHRRQSARCRPRADAAGILSLLWAPL
mmetsp:Transcript_34555/g.109961  ORF Transcript_34555/g.109961 Transcript_34555/m.109961 type:complete len:216 (+) Transcript_34555:266-913(+)